MPPRLQRRLKFALRALGVALCAAALPGCSPTTFLNATSSRDHFTLRKNVRFSSEDIALDVYIPADTEADGRLSTAAGAATTGERCAAPRPPIAVFVYGGSWQSGSKDEYLFVGAALASRGIVTVIPDYRTYPQVVFPAFVDDVAQAVRWAHDHAAALGADPDRLYVIGHSAGAQIALLIGTDGRYLAQQGLSRRDLQGVIGLSGPYDFLPLQSDTLKRIFPDAKRADSQPIRHVDGREPRTLLATGTADTVVDPGNTRRMADAMRASGDAVFTREYRNVGHGMTVGAMAGALRFVAPVLDDVTRFVCGGETS